MEIEALIIVVGAGIVIIEKTYKKIKYIKQKRKLKKKLIKSIQENDKNDIKKYVIKLKDFDKKYNKRKLLKYLDYSCRIINGLKEENVFSLLHDFNFLDMLYESEEEELNINIHYNLNEKLRELEKKRKEILIRNNQVQARVMFKSKKMEKNQKNKKKGKF